MEQRQYFPKAQKRRLRRERLKKWFSETFRAHTKEEYKEFFTRGFDGKDSLNNVYPWVYMRMLVLCFLLFAATTFFMRVSGNAISYPAMIFLGAIFVNLPFITLIYELCPKADLSFLKLMFVLVVGGTASVIITELGYLAFSPQNGYAAVAWTAFLEEIAKIIPAVGVILILKKRSSPLTCFALAAAVGAGISIIEDMGYIFFNSFDGNISLFTAIYVSVVRSVSGVATHTVWAGYVGWIFSKCKKPFLDVRFYAVSLMSMVLHFLWDLIAANGQLWSVLGILFGFIFCICFTRWLVKKERRLVLETPQVLPLAVSGTGHVAVETSALNTDGGAVGTVGEEIAVSGVTAVTAVEAVPAVEAVAAAEAVSAVEFVEPFSSAEPVPSVKPVATVSAAKQAPAAGAATAYTVYKDFPEETLEVKIKKRERYSQTANIIAAVAAIILGIVALTSCAVSIGYDYERKTFTEYQRQEFLNYVQNGYNLDYDWDRPLDESIPKTENYAFSFDGSNYTFITQVVEGKYLYRYDWYEPSAVGTQNGDNAEQLPEGWYLTDISVKIGDNVYPCVKLAESLELEGLETVDLSCYIIRDEVIGVYHDSIFGDYVAVIDNQVFYGILTLLGYIIGMGSVFAVGLFLFIIFKVQTKNLTKEITAATTETENTETVQTYSSADGETYNGTDGETAAAEENSAEEENLTESAENVEDNGADSNEEENSDDGEDGDAE